MMAETRFSFISPSLFIILSLFVIEPVEYAIAIGNNGKTKAVDVIAPGGGGGVECYNCREVGHMAKDCRGGSGGNRYGGRGYGGEGCYTCGDVGHFAMETLAIHVAELDTWLEFAQARESLVVVVVVLVMNVEALVIWHVTVIVEEEEAVAPVVASVSHAARKVTLRGTALRLLNKEKEE
ncbi:unnamed protein product [Brassica oleracea var. botrytis]|uniref:(rape) hypothetical protein n=1 Tax=Brassica napus TaxID=3708 RepID=A0A816JF51_BRANA|nr:unnamed protein product [Brassica napus]